jgi:hypothetical protein
MNKKEVVEVLKMVEAYFPGKLKVDDPNAMVAAWHRILKGYEFNNVMANLDTYAANNKFVPTVADLVKPPRAEVDRYVPSAEETIKLLKAQEENKEAVRNDPKVQEAKAKARAEIMKMLGRG